VGVFSVPHSDNILMANAFEELGHQVFRYDFRERVAELGSSAAMEDDLLQELRCQRPDLTVLSKFEGTSPEALLRYNGFTWTHFWFPDWEPNIGPEILGHFKHAASASCTGEPVAASVERQTGRKVWHVFDGCDPKVFRPVPPQSELACDVVFIGQSNPRRRRYLGILQGAGFDCAFRGPGFSAPVYLDDFCTACCSAKVNLSIHYGVWDGLFFSVRTWMVLGCQGFLLAEYVKGMERVFENGKHLVWYKSEDELLELLQRYLRATDAEEARARIARQGRELVLGNYTWVHTARRILDIARSTAPAAGVS
jgi:hypothetical protein